MSGGELPYTVQSNNSGTAMQKKQLYKMTWYMQNKHLCPKEAVLHEILKKWP